MVQRPVLLNIDELPLVKHLLIFVKQVYLRGLFKDAFNDLIVRLKAVLLGDRVEVPSLAIVGKEAVVHCLEIRRVSWDLLAVLSVMKRRIFYQFLGVQPDAHAINFMTRAQLFVIRMVRDHHVVVVLLVLLEERHPPVRIQPRLPSCHRDAFAAVEI